VRVPQHRNFRIAVIRAARTAEIVRPGCYRYTRQPRASRDWNHSNAGNEFTQRKSNFSSLGNTATVEGSDSNGFPRRSS